MCQANFLAMTMIAPLLRPSSVSMQQAWKSPSTALIALDSSFWGHKGVSRCHRHPQVPLFTQTSMPNLDPFLPLPLTVTSEQMTIKHLLFV